MPRPIRVLVIGVPLGGGHMAAANAIASHLRLAEPGRFAVSVEDIGDALSIAGRPLGPLLMAAYRWCVSSLGGRPQRYLFNLADRRPLEVSRLVTRIFRRQFEPWLHDRDPDIVISTFPVVSFAAAHALADCRVPVISVVTDAGRSNRIWFSGTISRFAFTSADAARWASLCGINDERVAEIGHLVHAEFTTPPSRPDARRRLGLDSRFTVLMATGAVGYGPGARTFAEIVAAAPEDVQLVVAPGGNDRLRGQFERILGGRAHFVPGGTRSLLPYISAADIIVGKAGWLTLMEASASGRPVLVVDRIQGQEYENAKEAADLGFARITSPTDAARLVIEYARGRRSVAADFSFHNHVDLSSSTRLASLIASHVVELSTDADATETSRRFDLVQTPRG